MIDLEELERLAKEATPGPWQIHKDHQANFVMESGSNPVRHISIPVGNREWMCDLEFSWKQNCSNAAYITAACNAVPDLIQRIRELEKSEKEKNVLHWTKEAPTKSGWYFLRLKCGACARRKPVYLDVENDLYFVNRSSKSRLKTRISELIEEESEFFGPIEEPIW